MVLKTSLTDCIEDSFSRYAGSVILDRAICDARDMLKPAARMLIYSQVKTTKNLADKPFVKSARVVGDCLGHWYTHGDSSCYGTYMRMAKSFAMRYPLEDCQGNSGTIITTGDEAASRYTELRLAKPAAKLYSGLQKNAIDKWNPNFDDTEEFPTVFPSVGFYNIVNGTSGIGVSLASSIPQFNIKEVNNAICKLIQNPEIDFKEIACLPDFATGAVLTNKDQVLESLKTGNGAACKLRAVMQYNPATNSIHITEIPFGVYTSTITQQLRGLTEADPKYGIEGIHDGSGQTVDYTIELSKGANPKKMIQKLYRDTSLEYWYGINMTMLDEGRFPKVFGWKEALTAHIDHASKCLRKEYQYDCDKLEARQHIVEGLLKAIADIDNVVSTIKSSKNSADAQNQLQIIYKFSELQAKAILDLKLNRLVNLEEDKLKTEYKDNQIEIDRFKELLSDINKFNESLIKLYQATANEFGDSRRTKILNETFEETEVETHSEELVVLMLSNETIRVLKNDEFVGAKRGRKGTSLKLPKDTAIVSTITTTNDNTIYVVTKMGKIYSFELDGIETGDYSIYDFIKIDTGDKVVKILNEQTLKYYKYLIFVTKCGIIKKSEISEYNFRSRGISALKLREHDQVVGCFAMQNNSEDVVIVSSAGYYNRYDHQLINAVGRNSIGVKAIALKDNEYVIAALPIRDALDSGIFSITANGKGKITAMSEFSKTSKAVRGLIAHKIDETNLAAAYYVHTLSDKANVINVISDGHLVTITTGDVPIQARNTVGIKIIERKKTDAPMCIV